MSRSKVRWNPYLPLRYALTIGGVRAAIGVLLARLSMSEDVRDVINVNVHGSGWSTSVALVRGESKDVWVPDPVLPSAGKTVVLRYEEERWNGDGEIRPMLSVEV